MEKCTVRIAVLAIFFQIQICTSFNIYNNACENYNEYFVRFWSTRCYYNPDVLSDTPTIISRHGYSLESYSLTTEDGYILTLFRIPPQNSKSHKQPVFLMHGILQNNGIWVNTGNRSLAFNLADRGYDVWLGSIRGSDFSKTHRRYQTSSKEFWDFNLDTLAYFDVGEQLKFVARVTGKWGSIIYIGYSMGSTLAFLYGSGYPIEANSLLSGIIALAPVLYFKDVPVVDQLVEISGPLERELIRLHAHGLFYQSSVNKIAVSLCANAPLACKKILEAFAGPLTDHFRPDELLLFFSHTPSGTSVQVLKHYKQFAQTGKVRRYDYGKIDNIKNYGLSEPRGYDLRYIKVPVYLFYGSNDAMVSQESAGCRKIVERVGELSKKNILCTKRLREVAV